MTRNPQGGPTPDHSEMAPGGASPSRLPNRDWQEAALCLLDLPDILTPAEVCGILRKDVSKPCKAVRALERSGLRVLKVGRDLRVMREDLAAFLKSIAN